MHQRIRRAGSVVVAALLVAVTCTTAHADGIPYYAQSNQIPNVLLLVDASPTMVPPVMGTTRARFSTAAKTLYELVKNKTEVRWGLMRTSFGTQNPFRCEPGAILVPIGSKATGSATTTAVQAALVDTYCKVLGWDLGNRVVNCNWYGATGIGAKCLASEGDPVCSTTIYQRDPIGSGRKDYAGALVPFDSSVTSGTAYHEWKRALDPNVDPTGFCRKHAMIFVSGGGGAVIDNCTDAAVQATRTLYDLPEQSPTYYAGKHITTYVAGFNLGDAGGSYATLDDMAEAGQGDIDDSVNPYDAKVPSDFNAIITRVLNKILAGNYTNSNPVISRDYLDLYQAYFSILEEPSSGEHYYAWQGHLQDFILDEDGLVSANQSQSFMGKVDVSTWLDQNAYSTRKVYTSYYDVSSSDLWKRAAFDSSNSSLFWNEFDLATDRDDNGDGIYDGDNVNYPADATLGTQADADALIRFIKGDTAILYADHLTARENWRMLDIYKSTPRLVGPPASFISDPTYEAFQKLHQARPDMLLVGSNGGMIHAFNAALNTTNTRQRYDGREIWAYAPRHLLSRMKDIWYMYPHPTFIDGTGSVMDVKNDRLGSVEAPWGTVMVIGDGIIGSESECTVDPVSGMMTYQCGYYNAIDVSALSGGVYVPDPLWEFTGDGDILEAVAMPEFGQLRDKTYPGLIRQVVFLPGRGNEIPSGNLTAGTFAAPIYIVDVVDVADESSYIAKIQLPWTNKTVGYPSPRGVRSRPLGVDTDNDLLTDRLYVGDMEGSLWRVDLSSDDPAKWVASTSRAQIFKPNVTYSVGTPALPITFPPAATYSPERDIWVYYGSGDPTTVAYGGPRGYFFMMEDKRTIASGSAKLNTVKFPVIQFLPGEGLAGEPVISNGIVFFTTYYMDVSGSGCQFGLSKLWALKYDSGAAALDTNGDGQVTTGDAKFIELGRGIPSAVVVGYDRWYVQVNNGTVGGTSGSLKSGAISGAGSIEPLMPYGWSEVTDTTSRIEATR